MTQIEKKKPKRSHVFLLKVGLTVAVIVFAGVIGMNMLKQHNIARAMANAPENSSPVKAMDITGTEWTPVIKSTGLVRPNQGAMLSAEASGTVKRILVKSGQTVNKGDVLVELDNDVEMATLRATEAQLPALRLTYQRYANLLKSQSVSQTEFDNAKANYDQVVATINSLKAAVERRKIVAPFAGKLGIVKVNEGQYITVGTEIVRVEDNSSMKVDFAITQKRLEQLEIGQKVTATADAREGQTFAARITAIDPAVDTSTGLIDLQATFEPSDGKKLLSGMFTRLNIALPTQYDQVVVPQVAISYNMYGEFIYVLEDLNDEDKEKLADSPTLDKTYRAKQITVMTEDRQGIYAKLKAGDLKPGDRIITAGTQRISNGSLVVVSDEKAVGTEQPAEKTNM
ncbi:efflux RND transporter periplasmic adaptor subunit [Lonepinella koalarum]|uniref:efflux RND transporter periplasmic adaptor subunit n=1 Tax=Lonepinella koalarum TaxID=53417 RepID=UPI0011E461BA|nr:efflux RND transporter periplasmic adaptor subunit [Lonepinella koalarum]TYG34525.1 efflux RND transporter periplasmic adaptor subunit [Lonepinella koalarum]